MALEHVSPGHEENGKIVTAFLKSPKRSERDDDARGQKTQDADRLPRIRLQRGLASGLSLIQVELLFV